MGDCHGMWYKRGVWVIFKGSGSKSLNLWYRSYFEGCYNLYRGFGDFDNIFFRSRPLRFLTFWEVGLSLKFWALLKIKIKTQIFKIDLTFSQYRQTFQDFSLLPRALFSRSPTLFLSKIKLKVFCSHFKKSQKSQPLPFTQNQTPFQNQSTLHPQPHSHYY